MRIERWSWARWRAAALAACALIIACDDARAAETLETKVTREGRLMQVQATLGADAPTALCYAVLADFDKLEEFVPGLVSSDIVSAPGEPILLHQVGEASAAFFDVTLDVTLAVSERPPVKIEFDRIEGNLRQMKGSWTVAGDEHHCDIAYHVDIEPAFWVPPLIGPMLMRKQVDAQLKGVLDEISRRANAATSP